MSSQTRRANMMQLQQAAPVASSFPFDDPTAELERMLGSPAPQLGRLGHQVTSIEQLERDIMPSFTPPENYGMEHKASTKPYDPLSKYGLTGGEFLMDMVMGGDTRAAKHSMFIGENPVDELGNRRPVYDPPIEEAFVPIDMIAGAGLPRAAMAAGKFGLKHSPEVAERATRAFSGGLAGMRPTMEMTAYHGSPHKFDKFKMSQIGTGEGAQAYGHGLYFAESKDVAGQYQKKLSEGQFHTIGGDVFEPRDILKNLNVRVVLEQSDGDIDSAIARANQVIKKIPDTQGAEYAKHDIKALEDIKARGGISRPQGHLYEVDIPEEHVKTFLDWDAPLSEQPAPVRKAFDEFAKSDKGIAYAQNYHSYKAGDTLADLPEFKDPRGDILNNVLGNADNQETLLRHGVKGIKYNDAMSRGAGGGTRNLVVFDEDIIRTMSRNGTDLSDTMKKLEAGNNGF